jgi:dihydroflavonol-4-reductase
MFDLQQARILVTGATGKLGREVLYHLNRQGIKPIVQVRKDSDTSYVDTLGLEKRTSDLRQETELAGLVDGIDAIIHCAAIVHFRRDRLTQFTGVNVFGALNLYQAASKAGVKRFVHVSSVVGIGAIPRRNGNNGSKRGPSVTANEEFEFNLGHLRVPYIMTKRAAEDELRKAAAESKTELVIVNPSIVVAPSRTGDDRGKARKMFGRFFMPDFRNWVNLVDIRDVAPGIIAALEKGRDGERYILAGDDITGHDLVLAVSSIIGRIPHLITIPRTLLNTAARFSLWWARVFGKSRIRFYPDLVKLLDYDWAFSSMKARKELNFSARSIYNTLEDLLQNNFLGTSRRGHPGE